MKEVKMTAHVLNTIDTFLKNGKDALMDVSNGYKPSPKWRDCTLNDFYNAVHICHLLQNEKFEKANELLESVDASILPWTIRKWIDKWFEAHIKQMKDHPFDKNLAPKGYYAVIQSKVEREESSCSGCAFNVFNVSSSCGPDRPCCQDERPDKQFVIFKKRKTSKH
ncbi:MAG: hypothetical protein WC119_00435 [Synergistaceae bacterium]